ncbi:MAG: deoxyribose-phosphate aldolase [Opitutaceae bacterium]|nr:deoxyribose-phosphate aldolase [Opitutaceae bacterium]
MTLPLPKSVAEVAALIDHSLLHPTMTDAQVRSGLEFTLKNGCASACVKPYSVPEAAAILRGSKSKVCAVVGFPHGNSHVGIKVTEARRAISEGSTEIDVVVNIGKVTSGDWRYVSNELKEFNHACVSEGAIVKVIFENDYLKEAEIIRLCELCTEHDVAFVKTSSGFGYVKQPNGDYNYLGATDEHLKLMRKHSGPKVGIKAAGGVRSFEDVMRVIPLGVTRIGAGSTAAILDAARARFEGGPAGAASKVDGY